MSILSWSATEHSNQVFHGPIGTGAREQIGGGAVLPDGVAKGKRGILSCNAGCV